MCVCVYVTICILNTYLCRCRGCVSNGFSKEDIFYHSDRFGNNTRGWRYYTNRTFIEASQEVYVTSEYVDSYMSDLHHGFMSVDAKCESYNELFRSSYEVNCIKDFLLKNPRVGGHFQTKTRETEEAGDDEPRSTIYELSSRALSSAIYSHEIIQECIERKTLSRELFGPKKDPNSKGGVMSFKETLNLVMDKVDLSRKDELYEHKVCADECKKRGCDTVIMCDGLWKLHYSICMFEVMG